MLVARNKNEMVNYSMEQNGSGMPNSNYYSNQQYQNQNAIPNQNNNPNSYSGQNMNMNDPNNNDQLRKKRKYTKRVEEDNANGENKKGTKAKSKKASTKDSNMMNKDASTLNPKVASLISETRKILSNRSIDELQLSEKIDLLPNSLINLLKNGKYAIVKYHGSTECIGIQKCDTMLGKKELKKIKELQFNSNELETSKALRIKFENDSKKSQHRFLIITPVVWKHWDWFNLQNAEIDYTKQQ